MTLALYGTEWTAILVLFCTSALAGGGTSSLAPDSKLAAGCLAAIILPAAIVAILEIGLVKFEEENNLSVDAAKVNPSPRARAGKKAPRVRQERGTSK